MDVLHFNFEKHEWRMTFSFIKTGYFRDVFLDTMRLSLLPRGANALVKFLSFFNVPQKWGIKTEPMVPFVFAWPIWSGRQGPFIL